MYCLTFHDYRTAKHSPVVALLHWEMERNVKLEFCATCCVKRTGQCGAPLQVGNCHENSIWTYSISGFNHAAMNDATIWEIRRHYSGILAMFKKGRTPEVSSTHITVIVIREAFLQPQLAWCSCGTPYITSESQMLRVRLFLSALFLIWKPGISTISIAYFRTAGTTSVAESIQ